MTISCEKTGDLYLNLKSYQIVDNKHGPVNFEVLGFTQGMGGEVKIKTAKIEKTIHVGPCSKAVIFGEEFWGEYADHPKRQNTKVSIVFPEPTNNPVK